MFERFSNQARRVVVLAQEESRALNHHHIGTEHLLLGLLREERGAGARALESAGITLEAARREVETRVGRGSEQAEGHIPFTRRAKKSLELSLRESLALGQDYIGTGHLLLGLMRQGDSVGAEVLVSLGADLNVVRGRVIELLNDDPEREGVERARERGTPPRPARTTGTVQALLELIDTRLTAIERHLGITRAGPEAREGAVTAEDFEAGAVAGEEPVTGEGPAPGEGSEAEPVAGGEPVAGESGEGRARDESGEVARLRDEVARLTALLREHGIDLGKPHDPPAAAG